MHAYMPDTIYNSVLLLFFCICTSGGHASVFSFKEHYKKYSTLPYKCITKERLPTVLYTSICVTLAYLQYLLVVISLNMVLKICMYIYIYTCFLQEVVSLLLLVRHHGCSQRWPVTTHPTGIQQTTASNCMLL